MTRRTVGAGELPMFEPTQGSNAEYDLTYDLNDNLIQIDKTVGRITYRLILTWSGGNLVNISEWTKL